MDAMREVVMIYYSIGPLAAKHENLTSCYLLIVFFTEANFKVFTASVLKEKLSSLGSSGILADHHLQAQMQEHHLKGWVADSYVELAILSEWTELCILICFIVWYYCANIFHVILLLFFSIRIHHFSLVCFPMVDQVMNHIWFCSKQRSHYYQGRLILVNDGMKYIIYLQDYL